MDGWTTADTTLFIETRPLQVQKARWWRKPVPPRSVMVAIRDAATRATIADLRQFGPWADGASGGHFAFARLTTLDCGDLLPLLHVRTAWCKADTVFRIDPVGRTYRDCGSDRSILWCSKSGDIMRGGPEPLEGLQGAIDAIGTGPTGVDGYERVISHDGHLVAEIHFEERGISKYRYQVTLYVGGELVYRTPYHWYTSTISIPAPADGGLQLTLEGRIVITIDLTGTQWRAPVLDDSWRPMSTIHEIDSHLTSC